MLMRWGPSRGKSYGGRLGIALGSVERGIARRLAQVRESGLSFYLVDNGISPDSYVL